MVPSAHGRLIDALAVNQQSVSIQDAPPSLSSPPLPSPLLLRLCPCPGDRYVQVVRWCLVWYWYGYWYRCSRSGWCWTLNATVGCALPVRPISGCPVYRIVLSMLYTAHCTVKGIHLSICVAASRPATAAGIVVAVYRPPTGRSFLGFGNLVRFFLFFSFFLIFFTFFFALSCVLRRFLGGRGSRQRLIGCTSHAGRATCDWHVISEANTTHYGVYGLVSAPANQKARRQSNQRRCLITTHSLTHFAVDRYIDR